MNGWNNLTDTVLVKQDLKLVWYAVRKTLTDEDIDWLKKNRKGTWGDFEGFCEPPTVSDWEIRESEGGVYSLSFKIQDIMDAKADQREADHLYAGGLPKKYIIEICKLFGLISYGNKFQLVYALLEHIKKQTA